MSPAQRHSQSTKYFGFVLPGPEAKIEAPRPRSQSNQRSPSVQQDPAVDKPHQTQPDPSRAGSKMLAGISLGQNTSHQQPPVSTPQTTNRHRLARRVRHARFIQRLYGPTLKIAVLLARNPGKASGLARRIDRVALSILNCNYPLKVNRPGSAATARHRAVERAQFNSILRFRRLRRLCRSKHTAKGVGHFKRKAGWNTLGGYYWQKRIAPLKRMLAHLAQHQPPFQQYINDVATNIYVSSNSTQLTNRPKPRPAFQLVVRLMDRLSKISRMSHLLVRQRTPLPLPPAALPRDMSDPVLLPMGPVTQQEARRRMQENSLLGMISKMLVPIRPTRSLSVGAARRPSPALSPAPSPAPLLATVAAPAQTRSRTESSKQSAQCYRKLKQYAKVRTSQKSGQPVAHIARRRHRSLALEIVVMSLFTAVHLVLLLAVFSIKFHYDASKVDQFDLFLWSN
ncbi:uncharacterized protein BJ171DRAFT_596310 [Polychytrium aggregatum]|uniref:uncharacterized protein n=1 Tax=Polychytrium aggregatum TaxID=110093 RepID=UPI0022FE46AD|nr:uncharacterized protein BJ171DRAFT_596310 [Polychytrium aggregatum]KAI9207886.1 hypothetical protein BJ171DRAFT_596310 [Polychytrium aggregatum]